MFYRDIIQYITLEYNILLSPQALLWSMGAVRPAPLSFPPVFLRGCIMEGDMSVGTN